MTHVQVDHEDKPQNYLKNNNNEIALPMMHFPPTIEALKKPNIL